MIKLEESKIISFVESLYSIKIKQKSRKEVLNRVISILSLVIDAKLKEEGLLGLTSLSKNVKFCEYLPNSLYSISEEYLKEKFSLNHLNPVWYSLSEQKYIFEKEMLFKAISYLEYLKKDDDKYKKISFDFIIYLYTFCDGSEKLRMNTIDKAVLLLKKQNKESIAAKVYISKLEKEESKLGFLEFFKILREKIDLEKIKTIMEKNKRMYGIVSLEGLNALETIEKEILS